ncbi:MAG: hypothetical protein VYC39_00160 [Myxococcota bacterium]|nr:hypothetical protein [Myxococcota bacterium]
MTEHYQAYFCEENIWHLARRISGVVLFISNSQNQFAIWKQKLAEQEKQESFGRDMAYIMWDYHVVLAHGPQETSRFENLSQYITQQDCLIYDFDSILRSPCPAKHYFSESFPVEKYSTSTDFRPLFRIIEGKEYVERFWSDRSHMKNERQEWSASPPSWPCIMSKENAPLRLSELLNFQEQQNTRLFRLEDFLFS